MKDDVSDGLGTHARFEQVAVFLFEVAELHLVEEPHPLDGLNFLNLVEGLLPGCFYLIVKSGSRLRKLGIGRKLLCVRGIRVPRFHRLTILFVLGLDLFDLGVRLGQLKPARHDLVDGGQAALLELRELLLAQEV